MDDADTWRWIWLAAAVAFAIGEIAAPGTFFLLSFAAGAAVACVLAFADVAVGWQWLVFVVATAVALAGLVPMGRRLDRASTGGAVGATRFAGQRAVVLESIPGAAHATGLVRLEREQWRAESAHGREIPAGTTVTVVRVDGTRLIVVPAPDTAADAAADQP
jgi:membrane protein implicated in regulation of membrane protease activity